MSGLPPTARLQPCVHVLLSTADAAAASASASASALVFMVSSPLSLPRDLGECILVLQNRRRAWQVASCLHPSAGLKF